LRRQNNVQEPTVEPQSFVFLIFLKKPTALTKLFIAELKLIECLYINENLPVGLRIAVSHTTGFQWGHGHALVFGEHAVNEAACREMAQAGVESVSGLGSAAGVHILDDMGGTIQHQNHLAFELGWQNRLHIVAARKCRDIWAATKAIESRLVARTMGGVNHFSPTLPHSHRLRKHRRCLHGQRKSVMAGAGSSPAGPLDERQEPLLHRIVFRSSTTWAPASAAGETTKPSCWT